MVAHHQPQYAGEQKYAQNIAAGPAHQQRQAKIHQQHQRHVIAMLPHQQAVALQIAHAAEIGLTARKIAQHPADVGKPEAAASTIWVALRIVDIAMMRAVTRAPDQCTVLQCHRAKQQIAEPEQRVRLVGAVCKQPVVATGDRHAVGTEEQREKDPGRCMVAMRDAVPGHNADRDREGQPEHQGIGPVAPCRLPNRRAHAHTPRCKPCIIIELQTL